MVADAVDLFLSAASRWPERVAEAPDVSYAGLAQRARQLAACLPQPAPRVLMALPRGADAYATMLAAGMAGGFHVPLNEAAPIDKQKRIAGLLQPDAIVGPRGLATALAGVAPGALVIDPAGPLPHTAMPGAGTRHATGYIIFTSGSTGVPKGVVIPRTALNHYVAWIHASDSVRAGDVVSQFNNLAFDVSILDIFGALCTGATLVPLQTRGDRLMPARAVARHGITVWSSVPSVIDLMRTGQQLTHANLGGVRLFTLAGEKLLRPQLDALFAACPDTVVQNAYGPTEATVTVTQMRMTRHDYAQACHGSNAAIGPPIPGMDIHLTGGPDPDEGEMVITGPQVADGYWNDAARTAHAFRPIMVGGQPVRGFHTGDWAVRRRGLLFFEQRIDQQVKLRGYRVELDEVAAAIMACGWPGVCVFKHGESLAALVECAAPGFDPAALKSELAARIEAYAIPEHVFAVPVLPRNENDKIDRTQAARLLETLLADMQHEP